MRIQNSTFSDMIFSVGSTYASMTANAVDLSFETNISAGNFANGKGNATVYFGYKNRVGQAVPQVRLNLPAANAMLGQLGLPLIVPTGPQ